MIGLVVLLGAAPATIALLFMFPLNGWLLLTVLMWAFLTLAALFGLWAVWQLLVVQLFPSARVAHPRALYVCILLGLIALSTAVYFALDQPWFVLAGLLLPVPATLHLLALYRSRHRRQQASDV
jgi:hypothetical protein